MEISQPKGKNIILGSVYRPPNGDKETLALFNSELCNILSLINKGKKKTVLIAGDFNMDLIKHDTHKPTEEFLDNFLSFSFCPVINHPTRITDSSSTLLDNIFTNSTPDKFNSAIICNDISDHLPVAIHLKPRNAVTSNSITHNPKTRIYSENAVYNFNMALLNHPDWSSVHTLSNSDQDANAAYDCFCGTYTRLYNKFFPAKICKIQ